MSFLIFSSSSDTWAANCKYCFETITDNETYCKTCKSRFVRGPIKEKLRSSATCEYCYEKTYEGEKYCEECKLRFSRDISDIKSREEQNVRILNTARDDYRRALTNLLQHYLDIGNHFRLKAAKRELKALNKVPQYKFFIEKENFTINRLTRNIEDANRLFSEGVVYKNSLNLLNKKTKLLYAVSMFESVINDYPESDKVDDAAYELAGIYEGHHFKDYETAAYYYVKCYESNPDTEKPASYMAGRIYDVYIKDIVQAKQNYELTLETCKDKEYLEKALLRLVEFKEQGY